jgi:hypothetical protein
MILSRNSDYFPKNSINQFIFVTEMLCILFEVGTEFLNIIKLNFIINIIKGDR